MNEPHKYIVVSNGHIHDATGNSNLALYSAESLNEQSKEGVAIYTLSSYFYPKEEK